METRLSISSSKGSFWAQLGLFLLGLVALDSLVSVAIDKIAPPDYVKAIQSKSQFDSSKTYDVWIVGDSLAADAVTPSAFQETSGKSVFNWGVYATSPFEWEVMISDLLGRSSAPKTAVIVCHPHMFIKRPNDGPFATETFRSPQVTAGLFWGSVFRDDLSAIFASGRKKLIWKSALGKVGKRGAVPETEFLPLDHGYQGTTKELTETPKLMVDALRFDRATAEFQSRALDGLIRQLEAKGVHVLLLRTPISLNQLRAYEQEPETWVDFNLRIDRLQTRGLQLLNLQDEEHCSQMVPQDFTDAIHLSHRGSVALTRDLASWVRVVSP